MAADDSGSESGLPDVPAHAKSAAALNPLPMNSFSGGLVLPSLEGVPRARIAVAIRQAVRCRIRDCLNNPDVMEEHDKHCHGMVTQMQRQKEAERQRYQQKRLAKLEAIALHRQQMSVAASTPSFGLSSAGYSDAMQLGPQHARRLEVLQRKEELQAAKYQGLLDRVEEKGATVHNPDWLRARQWLIFTTIAKSVAKMHRFAKPHRVRAVSVARQKWAYTGGAQVDNGSDHARSPSEASAERAAMEAYNEGLVQSDPRKVVDVSKAYLHAKRVAEAKRFFAELPPEAAKACAVVGHGCLRYWRRVRGKIRERCADLVGLFLQHHRETSAIPRGINLYRRAVIKAQGYIKDYLTIRRHRRLVVRLQWKTVEDEWRAEMVQERRREIRRINDKYNPKKGPKNGPKTARRTGPPLRMSQEDQVRLMKLTTSRIPDIPEPMVWAVLSRQLTAWRHEYLLAFDRWRRAVVDYQLKIKSREKWKSVAVENYNAPEHEKLVCPARPVLRCLLPKAELKLHLKECATSIEAEIANRIISEFAKSPESSPASHAAEL